MAKIKEVFNSLVETKSLRIRTGTKQEHERLRIRLVKCFSAHKKLLASIGASDDSDSLSLSATYFPDEGISNFYIRARQSRFGNSGTQEKEYEIL